VSAEWETRDRRIAAARARLAVAETRAVRDMSPDDLAAECIALRAALRGALTVIGELWITEPAPQSVRDRQRAELLAEVPRSQRATDPEGDQAWAVATVLTAIGDDVARVVTGWLRAAREEMS
jgi:hypothetical protein